MSTAQVSRSITFIPKVGQYVPNIMSPQGDVYQEWTGADASSPTKVYPDWATLKPILYFYVTSSRTAEGTPIPANFYVYVNNTIIAQSVNGTVSTFANAGLATSDFTLISPSASNGNRWGLQFLKNIVAKMNGISPIVKMVGEITFNGVSASVQATYTIPITKSTNGGWRATIIPGDSYNFTVGQEINTTTHAINTSCVLKAQLTCEGADKTSESGVTFQWYECSTGAWVAMAGKTANTLTVTTDMVSSSRKYRLGITYAGNTYYDTETVYDESDELTIAPNPSPEDETIEEDNTNRSGVTYTPVLKRKVSGGYAAVTVTPAHGSTLQFYFTVMSAVGVILNASDCATLKSSYKVTSAHCNVEHTNVSLIITTDDFTE